MPHPPQPFTPCLWVAQSRYFLTNSGLFIQGDRVCLVDPGVAPDELAALAHFLAARHLSPELLILTHAHWDHLLGPAQFPGVPVWAQQRYPEVLQAHGADLQRQIAAWAAQEQLAGVERFSLPLPTSTFAALATVTVGELTLQLFHAPGHAPDQCVIYEPAGAILWAADLLSDVEIPLVSDRLDAYEQTLAQLAGLELRFLVPGHGTPTADPAAIRTRLEEDRTYLAALRARVTAAVERGATVEETVAACADLPFRCPEVNAGYHRWNVESVYLELGGQPGPGKWGWEQEWEA